MYLKGLIKMNFAFDFYMPVNILGGENALVKNRNIFNNLGRKCLIVTGKTSAKKSGALDDVINVFNELNIEYEIYDKITENPLTIDCYVGGKIAREINADFVLGIGGGSPLDAAKAICVYATNTHIVDDGIYSEPVAEAPLPLVLIGTTSGTGSEVSGVSVLTRKDGRKQSIGGKNYYARYVIADPRYTYSMPFSTTVSTALDALCHAVESMFSPRADFLSKKFALLSAEMLYPLLHKMSKTQALPDEKERNTLYYASLYAGFALNKGGTGFPHGMGYALTEDFNVPHGLACAVFLPTYLKEAEKADAELFRDLMTVMNTDLSSLENMFKQFSNFDFNISDERISEYISRWETLKNFKNSPTDFNHIDAGKLVKSLFN